jgi:hypothetical protein
MTPKDHEAWIGATTFQQYRILLLGEKRRAAMRKIYKDQLQRACDRLAESRELLSKVDRLLKR